MLAEAVWRLAYEVAVRALMEKSGARTTEAGLKATRPLWQQGILAGQLDEE